MNPWIGRCQKIMVAFERAASLPFQLTQQSAAKCNICLDNHWSPLYPSLYATMFLWLQSHHIATRKRNWVSLANILVYHCFASKDQKSALESNLRLCQINIAILQSLEQWRTSSIPWLHLQHLELGAIWRLKCTRFIGRLSWKISQTSFYTSLKHLTSIANSNPSHFGHAHLYSKATNRRIS